MNIGVLGFMSTDAPIGDPKPAPIEILPPLESAPTDKYFPNGSAVKAGDA
jgi:hypothetical protein